MNHKRVHDLIKKSKRILISAHVNPDLDAICSELAMFQYLRSLKKEVFVIHEKPVALMYHFLAGIKQIKGSVPCRLDYDLLIVLDCGELNRIGEVQKILLKGKPIINIDHHLTNQYFGSVNIVCPNTSSTAEVIFEMFKAWKVKITKKMAQYLYVGILTDTGSFRYQNTTPRTHEVVAELLRAGFSQSCFYRLAYEDIEIKGFEALLRAVNGAKYFKGGRVVCVFLSRKIQREIAEKFDLKDKIFYILRMIRNVEVIIIFSEVAPSKTRINFRSTGMINVAAIAEFYHGGGHRAASGCVLDTNIHIAQKKILPQILKKIT
ncbi:MAG: bifunctional oligoribonuclease/PAP phosphatase NrnA [Candidatus Omnitrophica bacterium]|nr:bifunctional oligoribonuclease/PAP phosphatase NrnA [Candidatus Omnitrophota bacterium]